MPPSQVHTEAHVTCPTRSLYWQQTEPDTQLRAFNHCSPLSSDAGIRVTRYISQTLLLLFTKLLPCVMLQPRTYTKPDSGAFLTLQQQTKTWMATITSQLSKNLPLTLVSIFVDYWSFILACINAPHSRIFSVASMKFIKI